MSTPLYTTDVQKITDRTPKTSLVDADVFVVANSSGVLAPLTKVNAKTTLGIDANATAITLKADKDADAVTGNFAMFDAGGTPVDSGKKDADYEDADATILKQANIVNDLTTGGTTVPLSAEQGKVLKTAQLLKAEKTELNALDLAHLTELNVLKDKITAQNNRINTLLAEVYTDDPILSYASTVANGVGYVSGSAVDISATVQDGGFSALGIKGETLTNLVDGAGIIATGTVTFASILNHIYFDTLHGTKVTGTGSDITLTNDSGVTADMAVYNITSLGIPTVADAILVSRLPYIVGTESVGEQVIYSEDADGNKQYAYLPPTLRRVPSASDEMRQANVGWEHVKNVGEKLLSDITYSARIADDTSNHYCVSASAIFSDSLIDTNGAYMVIGYSGIRTDLVTFNATDELASYLTTVGTFRFHIPKSEISSISDANVKTWLTDNAITTMSYQLATPVTTQYPNIPHLPCYEGGSTTRFPGTKKVVLYGTGITFTKNVLSVTQATKFYGGVETDITSSAVISGTGVTFAGTEATAVVLIKVAYDVDEPIGELSSVPTVENTKSRLADLESRVTALEV